MATTTNELLRDPLFQLNAILWLAQPLPDGGRISPLLHNAGFRVYAIAPLLGPPPDVRLAAQQAGVALQERVRPDVVLNHERDRKFAFVECKASSFSTSSSQADQARCLLMVGGPRAEDALGLASGQVADCLVAFLIPDEERERLVGVVDGLAKGLKDQSLPTGRSAVVGLTLTEVAVCVILDGGASRFFGIPARPSPFIGRDPDTDPRPLYFIPYDPDVVQSEEEGAFCKRALFERMHGTILAAVGHARPPTELLLQSNEILNDAMFGMYEHWENQDSDRHMRRLCRHLVDAIAGAVNSVAPGAIVSPSPNRWRVLLQDQGQHTAVLDALERFSSETLDSRPEPPPGLFDDV
jgi:hypothetical protein